MDKKSLLAFVFIFVIIILMPSYFKWLNRNQPINESQPISEEPFIPTSPVSMSTHEEGKKPAALRDKQPAQYYRIENELYIAVFSSRGGGTLHQLTLKNYETRSAGDTALVQLVPVNESLPLLIKYIALDGDSVTLDQNFSLTEPLLTSPDDTSFSINGRDSLVLVFNLLENGRNYARKKLTFRGNQYSIGVSITLFELADQTATGTFEMGWQGGLNYTEPDLIDETRYAKAYGYCAGETDDFDVKAGRSDQVRFSGKTDWTAIRTKYFTAALISKQPAVGYRLTGSGTSGDRKSYFKNFAMYLSLPANKTADVDLFVGPLDYLTIKDLGVNLENIMSLGKILRPISKAILWSFIQMHRLIPNYGLVLIIFAVLIKIFLNPLTSKSMRSAREMQKIQPLIEEIRLKYKNDPQKLNTAQMKLFKEHGVNPMGGCLPLLLQMPILFALFTVFRSTIELRHAPFIWWITDLSAPDTIFTLPFTLPLYGNHVNILPIIMAISTIFQQKLSGVSSSNPQQKMMMYMMPVMFFFMFNQFPSGLNLYYTLFNILSAVQQKYFPPKARPARKKQSLLEMAREVGSKTRKR